MIDITNEIAAIQVATTGSAIRSALVEALSVLNSHAPVWYSGAYIVNPSTSEIVVPVSGKAMASDLVIRSYSTASTYSGSYTVTPSTVSQSIPTSGYLMASDIVIEPYSIPSPSLISKSISTNGVYSASDYGAEGFSQIEVAVLSPYVIIEEWDFTGSEPLIGKVRSMSAEMSGMTFGDHGAIFDDESKYLAFPSELASITRVIEIEVYSMSVASTSKHNRFLMAGTMGEGFIFRNSGYWGMYNSSSWHMTTNSNKSLFDNSIMDVVINDNNQWGIYKDGSLVVSPDSGTILPLGSESIRLGETNGQSFNDAVISKIRFYSMPYSPYNSFPLH